LQCIDAQVEGNRAVLRKRARFRERSAPAIQFPWSWLYSAGHPVLHLNDISRADKREHPDTGVIDHIAFSCRGFEATKQHLIRKSVQFRVNQVPNSTR
jgi:hypothetical protein